MGILIIIIIGVVMLGGLVYVGMKENSGDDPLQARLAEYADREVPATLEELELSIGFRDRVLVPVFKTLANFVSQFTPEQQLESTRKQLILAGTAHKTDARTFFGTRIMMTALMGGGGFVLFAVVTHQAPLNAILYTVGFAALGYYLPWMQLKSQITRRQKNIT